MKAKLEFNLPDDRNDFLLAVNGPKYFNCLWEMKKLLRDELKYGDFSSEQRKIVEEIQKFFFEILEDDGINLDEID